MSAFFGGVAQGFLNAKLRREDAAAEAEKQRIAGLEKEKDRQVRRDIADKEVEMRRQTLKQQQESAQKTSDFRKVSNLATLVKSVVRQNPNEDFRNRISAKDMELFPQFGLGSFTNGKYSLGADIANVAAGETKEKGLISAASLIATGKADPAQLEENPELNKVYANMMGFKVSDKKYNTHVSSLSSKYNLKESILGKHNAIEAFGTPNIIQYSVGNNLYKYDKGVVPGEIHKTGFEGTAGTDKLPAESGAKYRTKNTILFDFATLKSAEDLLEDLRLKGDKGQIGKNKLKAYHNHVLKFKNQFINVQNASVRGGGFIPHFTLNSSGGVNPQPTQIKVGNIKELFPNLYKVLGKQTNIDTIINASNTDVDTRTPENRAKVMAPALGMTSDEYVAAERAGDIVTKHETLARTNPGRRVGDNLSSATSVQSIIPNPSMNNAQKTTRELPVSPKPDLRSTDDSGNQRFILDLQTTSNKVASSDINLLFQANTMREADRRALFTTRPDLSKQYDLMVTNELFKTLNLAREDAKNGGNKYYTQLADKVAKTFDIQRNGTGATDVASVQDAIRLLVNQDIMDQLRPPVKTSQIGNKQIIQVSAIPRRTDTRVTIEKQKLQESIEKGRQAKSNANSFINNIRRMGIVKLIKTGDYTPSEKLSMLDSLKNNPSFLEAFTGQQLPGVMSRMNVTVKDLEKIGFQESSDPKATVESKIQYVQDLGKAFMHGINKLRAVVDRGILINADEMRIKNAPEKYLKSSNFSSSEFDSGNDAGTVSRLSDTEKLAGVYFERYNTSLNSYLNQAETAYKNKDFQKAAEFEALAYEQYLLAQNTMTKVTLTYTFAGMVQGESGGRAISNEDFAIIFQALWGGASGETGRGSFDRLQEVLNDIALRNKNIERFIELEGGPEAAREMLAVEQMLLRNKHRDLYEASKTFNLLNFAQTGLSSPKPESSANFKFPERILDTIEENNVRSNFSRQINDENKTRYSTRFNNFVATSISKDMISGGGSFESLSNNQGGPRSKIISTAINNLTETLYDNKDTFQLNEQVYDVFNNFGNRGLRFGDAVATYYRYNKVLAAAGRDPSNQNYQEELQKTKDKATSSFNLITDVVEAIYNQKFPQLPQQQG